MLEGTNLLDETIRKVASNMKDQDVELYLVVAQPGTASRRCDPRLDSTCVATHSMHPFSLRGRTQQRERE